MKKLCCSIFLILCTFNLAHAACDPTLDPCLPQKELNAWKKSLALGFNKTSGNSDTMLATTLIDINKETKKDIWNFNLQYGYGEDSTQVKEAGADDTNRNDARSNLTYKYFLSDRSYLGLDNRLLYDEIAEVDYRYNITPLVGYYLIKDSDYTFNLETGPGYILERVGGETDDYLAPRIGQGFTWTISCTSKIFQTADITLDVNDSDNYLIASTAGVEAALNSELSMLFFIRHNYDNTPAADTEKDDLAIISALKVNL